MVLLPNQELLCGATRACLHTVWYWKHFHISGGVTGAWAQQLAAARRAVSVSKTAQPPSIMIMLCGVNKALLARLPWPQYDVSGWCKEQFTNMWNSHFAQGWTERREETSLSGPHRILFDWALHTRPLIACDWWRKELEETFNLQCIMGSWPMSTKSCLCLVAVFLFVRRWEGVIRISEACVCVEIESMCEWVTEKKAEFFRRPLRRSQEQKHGSIRVELEWKYFTKMVSKIMTWTCARLFKDFSIFSLFEPLESLFVALMHKLRYVLRPNEGNQRLMHLVGANKPSHSPFWAYML